MGQGALAGQAVVSGRVPDQLALTTVTADSSAFTSEAVVATVAAYLFEGRTYAIRWRGNFASNDATDRVVTRLREDSLTGTQHTNHTVLIVDTSVTGKPSDVEFEYQAAADGDKTFVATAQRASGGGTTTRLRAATGQPATLSVEYVRG